MRQGKTMWSKATRHNETSKREQQRKIVLKNTHSLSIFSDFPKMKMPTTDHHWYDGGISSVDANRCLPQFVDVLAHARTRQFSSANEKSCSLIYFTVDFPFFHMRLTTEHWQLRVFVCVCDCVRLSFRFCFVQSSSSKSSIRLAFSFRINAIHSMILSTKTRKCFSDFPATIKYKRIGKLFENESKRNIKHQNRLLFACQTREDTTVLWPTETQYWLDIETMEQRIVYVRRIGSCVWCDHSLTLAHKSKTPSVIASLVGHFDSFAGWTMTRVAAIGRKTLSKIMRKM